MLWQNAVQSVSDGGSIIATIGTVKIEFTGNLTGEPRRYRIGSTT